MQRLTAALAAMLLLAASGVACSDSLPAPAADDLEREGLDGGKTAPKTRPVGVTAALARGVAIQEVAVFQGTRVPLAQSGTKVAATGMPVVAGRDALVRAYVIPQGAAGRSIHGELHLVRNGQSVGKFDDDVVVSGPSREEAPETTFDFNVPGSLIATDTEFLVRLTEEGAPAVPTTTVSPAQLPQNGVPASMDAVFGTDKLRVMIVPVRYSADGSNRLPEISAAVLDAVRKRMLEFYPVPDVELTVRAPIDFANPITGDGQGWSLLLERITQVRLQDNPAPDVYYYGAFAAAPSLSSFCTKDCIMGLSNFADNAGDAAQRASIGALHAVNEAIDTVPHEIGHAHGREHAPCGNAAGADPGYPYGGAVIGAWGYSVVTKSLKRPSLYDQMSYCTPAWQSDYTYRALFDRVRGVGELRLKSARASGDGEAGERTYRTLSVGQDGSLTWSGEPFRTRVALQGTPQPVAFLGARGEVLAETVGHAYRHSHLASGSIIVPYDVAKSSVARIRLDVAGGKSAVIESVRRRYGLRAEVVAN